MYGHRVTVVWKEHIEWDQGTPVDSIYDWCDVNILDYRYTLHNDNITYRFTTQEDATMFKLRFGGDYYYNKDQQVC